MTANIISQAAHCPTLELPSQHLSLEKEREGGRDGGMDERQIGIDERQIGREGKQIGREAEGQGGRGAEGRRGRGAEIEAEM